MTRLIESIIRDVAELPDRSSPDDFPEAMLVTADELQEIIERHVITNATTIEADSGKALQKEVMYHYNLGLSVQGKPLTHNDVINKTLPFVTKLSNYFEQINIELQVDNETLVTVNNKMAGEIVALQADNERLREALKNADEFITNGVEFGYIRMPDESLKGIDSAHDTPKIIREALSTTTSESLQAHDNEVLSKLRVINWTESMSVAWHKAIPDLHKAFDDLIELLKGK